MTPHQESVEEWRPIFEGIYSVSNLGRIRREVIYRNKTKDGVMRLRMDTHGYMKCTFCIRGKKFSKFVSRCVAEAFIGPRPPGYEVNHKNGIKTDNSISNLEYLTPRQNKDHAMENGFYLRGEDNYRAILSVDDVHMVRQLTADGLSRAEIGRRYGVSPSTIGLLVRGKTWKCIPVKEAV